MNELNLIYFAGFIDGEGCISTFSFKAYGKRAHNTRSRQLISLSATNVNRQVLDDLQSTFGGYVCLHSFPIGNRKECWRWYIRSKKASEAIKALLPYLRIKRKQAELCLEYQDTLVESSIIRQGTTAPNSPHRFVDNIVKPEILAKRNLIVNELRLLNKRGKA